MSASQEIACRNLRSSPQWLHSPASHGAAHRFLNALNRCINRRMRLGVLGIDDHAWLATHDNLHTASLVDATAWTVDVINAHADAFNRRRELAKFLMQLALRVRSFIGAEVGASGANVNRKRLIRGCVARSLGAARASPGLSLIVSYVLARELAMTRRSRACRRGPTVSLA